MLHIAHQLHDYEPVLIKLGLTTLADTVAVIRGGGDRWIAPPWFMFFYNKLFTFRRFRTEELKIIFFPFHQTLTIKIASIRRMDIITVPTYNVQCARDRLSSCAHIV